MVDMATLAQEHTTEANKARIRGRHASEARLKYMGVAAILVAGLALVTLLSTVLGKAVGALTEHYLLIETALPADEIDPENIGKANYDGLRKDALKAAFPNVTGRKDRRALSMTSPPLAPVSSCVRRSSRTHRWWGRPSPTAISPRMTPIST
jgi:phosphate transport system permease protein